MRYEPYIMVMRRNLPLYNEMFANRGYNRVSHLTSLAALGYLPIMYFILKT